MNRVCGTTKLVSEIAICFCVTGDGGADHRVGSGIGILRVGFQAAIFAARKYVEIQKPNVWPTSSLRSPLIYYCFAA